MNDTELLRVIDERLNYLTAHHASDEEIRAAMHDIDTEEPG